MQGFPPFAQRGSHLAHSPPAPRPRPPPHTPYASTPHARRVEEMKKVGRMVTEQELSVEERNLLSVAYKNVIGARRASWRIISSIEQKEESKGNEEHVQRIRTYRKMVRARRGTERVGKAGRGPPPPPPFAAAAAAAAAGTAAAQRRRRTPAARQLRATNPPPFPTLTLPQVEQELSDICASILQLLDEHLIPTASTGESKVFYLKMKGDYHRYLAEFKTGSDRKEAAEHTLLAYKAAQVGPVCAPGVAMAALMLRSKPST